MDAFSSIVKGLVLGYTKLGDVGLLGIMRSFWWLIVYLEILLEILSLKENVMQRLLLI